MKKIILALTLMISSGFALDFGMFYLSPEVGATLSYSKADGEEKVTSSSTTFNNDTLFSAGAYARVWLGIAGFMIAPQVKYDYLGSKFSSNHNDKSPFTSIHNVQYGGVLGYRIPVIKLTPFVGMSYSTFPEKIFGHEKLEDTFSVNFGARWEIPLIPFLIIGFEGSWQKPKLNTQSQNTKEATLEMLNLGASIGFAF